MNRDCSAYLLQVLGRTWHAKIMGLVCGSNPEVRRLSMISEPEHHHRQMQNMGPMPSFHSYFTLLLQ